MAITSPIQGQAFNGMVILKQDYQVAVMVIFLKMFCVIFVI